MATTLLLTGFEPFGDWKTNPSYDALKLADNTGLFDAPDIEVCIAEVPVAYDSAFETVQMLVESENPTAIVHFGLHGGLKRANDVIYIETTARNRNGATKADNSGQKRDATKIIVNAADTIATTLPVSTICNTLQGAGLRAETSDDAGAYLCNYLFFRTLHAYGQKIPCGFIHVPPVDTLGGVITVERLANAVASIARVVSSY